MVPSLKSPFATGTRCGRRGVLQAYDLARRSSGGEFHRHDQANDAPVSPLYDEAKTAVKSAVANFGSGDALFLMVEKKFRFTTCKL